MRRAAMRMVSCFECVLCASDAALCAGRIGPGRLAPSSAAHRGHITCRDGGAGVRVGGLVGCCCPATEAFAGEDRDAKCCTLYEAVGGASVSGVCCLADARAQVRAFFPLV